MTAANSLRSYLTKLQANLVRQQQELAAALPVQVRLQAVSDELFAAWTTMPGYPNGTLTPTAFQAAIAHPISSSQPGQYGADDETANLLLMVSAIDEIIIPLNTINDTVTRTQLQVTALTWMIVHIQEIIAEV